MRFNVQCQTENCCMLMTLVKKDLLLEFYECEECKQKVSVKVMMITDLVNEKCVSCDCQNTNAFIQKAQNKQKVRLKHE